jgi:hypothetical protein
VLAQRACYHAVTLLDEVADPGPADGHASAIAHWLALQTEANALLRHGTAVTNFAVTSSASMNGKRFTRAWNFADGVGQISQPR